MKSKRKCVAAIATAVVSAALSPSATAQNNVTVYGVLDTFITNIRAEGSPSVVRLDSSSLLASRLGFRGSEDIGNGYKVNFTLEAGLNADDGSGADSNRLFNRQAWVGVVTPIGEIRLGRQNTPQFFMNGRFDAFNGATQASGWNNMYGFAPRVDNAIGYFSPKVAGFKVHALVGRGAVGGAPATTAEIAGNQNVHLAAEYEEGPVYVGLTYEAIKNVAALGKVSRTALGAAYSISPAWTIFAATEHETRSDGGVDADLHSVSTRYAVTPVSSVALGYATTRDKLTGVGHGDAAEISALYRYELSKRTTVFAALSRIDQSGLRNNFSLNGAAVVSPGSQVRTLVPGGAINGAQVGITHSF